MTLSDAKAFRLKCVREGKRSDGCTMVPDFIFFFACQMHDFLLKFSDQTRKQSDYLYRDYMLELSKGNVFYTAIAYIYFIGVRYINVVFGGNFIVAIMVNFFALIAIVIYFFEVY